MSRVSVVRISIQWLIDLYKLQDDKELSVSLVHRRYPSVSLATRHRHSHFLDNFVQGPGGNRS